MSISSVQSTGTFADNATSIADSYDSNVTAGNLLVIYGMKYSPSDADPFVLGDISQSAGTATLGSFTLDAEHFVDVGTEGMYVGIYSAPVTGTGSCTIQVAGAASGSYLLLAIDELSGADVTGSRVEDTAEDDGAGLSIDTGNATSAAGAVFCGCVATYAASATSFTPDGAFTTLYEQETVDHATGSAIRRIVGSGTTDSASWTQGVDDEWAAVLVVYKEATVTTTLEQSAYRIYDDDAVPGSATALAAANTAAVVIVDENFRARVQVNATGDPATTPYRLEYRRQVTGTPTWSDWLPVPVARPLPLAVSATNPRYLEDENGRAIFLAGFHTWYNIQNGGGTNPPAAFGWDEYLSALVNYGCNFTKLWASMETAQNWADPLGSGFNPQYFRPERYERTGTATATDGGPQFDLNRISHQFLTRLVERAEDCYHNGIYVVVQLFQGWQIEDKGGGTQPFDYHPYRSANNVNSVNGDANADGDGTETHTDSSNNAWSYQQAFITAVVTLLNPYPHIIYEVSNEDTGSTNNNDWQEAVIDHIQSIEAGLPNQHLTMRTVAYPSGSNTDLDASDAEVVSYNAGKADDVLDGDKVAMRDSDHVEGIATDYDWVWPAVCNGSGGVWYMDEWDGALYGTDRRSNPTYQAIRANLGYALMMTRRVRDLLLMTPQPSLASTTYCLARNHATAADYLVYYDGSSTFTLNLTTATGTLNIYWLRCSDGSVNSGSTVSGGAVRTLTPPWTGRVVAHVYH